MDYTPSISVVIPAYNAETTIARAIDSVLSQTYPPNQIIIVDDGSADGTAEIVAQYSAPVKLLRQSNRGPGAARNLAARVASSDWLAFLDADDSWLPTKLEQQVAYTSDPDVSLICSYWYRLPDERLTHERAFQFLWKSNFVMMSSVLLRKSVFESVNGFCEDQEIISVEDYNLWLRITNGTNGVFIATENTNIYYTPSIGHLSSQSIRVLNAEISNLKYFYGIKSINHNKFKNKWRYIYKKIGLGHFYRREMKDARIILRAILKDQPDFLVFSRWMLTFLPSLFWERERRSRQQAFEWERGPHSIKSNNRKN